MILNNGNKEWIGKIPKSWQLKRLKYVLFQRNEKNNPIKSKDILSLTAKQGVIPYSEKEGGGNKPKNNFTDYKLAYPGDIVMNSMNILSGSVGISSYFGCVSPVYYMLKAITPNNTKYYYYLFANHAFQSSLLGIGNGILVKKSSTGKLNTIRMRVPVEKLNNLIVPVPKPTEQIKISKFLDKKCSEIDKVSQNIYFEINNLEEYRKKIISEKITKGLYSNIQMRDSGIKWLGNIPVNWKLEKIKFLTTLRTEKALLSDVHNKYIGLENIEKYTGKVIETGTDYEESYYDFCKKGDILFSKLRPNLSKATISPYDSCCTGEFVVIKDSRIEKKFLLYYLLSTNINEVTTAATYGTKMPRINWDFLGNLKIAFPGKKEQVEIINYLDKRCKQIDQVIKNKKELLNTINEYKQSLIYEYVTGKKQVPNVGEN